MWKKAMSLFRYKLTYSGLRCVSNLSSQGYRHAALSGNLHVSEEVSSALHHKKPVVALESTIITHGMPFPENLQTAVMVENVVRQNGSIPATVAVIKGKLHVGLSTDQLQGLAENTSGSIKTSRRDLPFVLSQGLTGGTTVSGTMVAAHLVGIHVFVTGGIGGVHRGAENTMDISADLTELGRTPVAVVSAGVKSILDIGRTLEYLETQGVCVSTYGESKDFPAFFTPNSGFKSPYNVTAPKAAAELIDSCLSLGLGSGVLIAVPIPEEEAAAGAEIEAAIQIAVEEAEEKNITGKEVTPFILARVNEVTEGRSLTANIALIKNNATVGSRIAVELSKLQSRGPPPGAQVRVTRGVDKEGSERKSRGKEARPVIIGGINMDFTARFKVSKPKANGATYPGEIKQSFGGVGRNIASCLSRLGSNPLFLSAMGQDNYAEYFFQQSDHMDLSGVRLCENIPSAVYCATLEDHGELLYGLGDFSVHDHITPDYISQFASDIKHASLVCVDGNIPVETIAFIADLCHENGTPVWFEPTDLHHATKPFLSSASRKLNYMSPNMNELKIMHAYVTNAGPANTQGSNPEGNQQETITEALRLAPPLLEHVQNLLVTLGQHGALFVSQDTALHCPPRPPHLKPPAIISVSGAGDCLAAGFISHLIGGQPIAACLKAGVLASQCSLLSHHAVPVNITPNTLSPQAMAALDPWHIQEVSL